MTGATMPATANRRAPTGDFDFSLTRALVPLKDMSEAHLHELLSGAEVETFFRGQTVFRSGARDGQHIYLLHGDVSLTDEQGNYTRVRGGNTLEPIGHSQPRRHTAMAESDCGVLRLDSEALDKLLTWSEVADYLLLNISDQRDFDEDVDWMMTVLRSNLFFKVSPLNVEEIFSRLDAMVVDAGEVILRQGEMGDRCYFIKEGRARVSRREGEADQDLAEIDVGRCFGEDALVNEAPRNATVTMTTSGVLMTLDKQDFYRLLREPEVPTLNLDALARPAGEHPVVVDVRSEEEYNRGHWPGSVNLPLNLMAIKARLLDREQPYVFYCDTGRRSRAATHLLHRLGYQVTALSDCGALFSRDAWRERLECDTNHVLRGGQPVLGH